EFNIFQKICEEILDFGESIQYMAILIAKVDCLNGFAELAIANNFTKPLIHKNYDVNLSEARHPVVEKTLETGDFTPNSTNLNQRKFVHLITGPNMSGKSTYIRQVALIQLLAQMGSFVPAEKAEISIVDGIYTRIGAGDALAQGLSTFMVEIIENGKILNNATKDSLIILDEIGRGTSTIDGLSIARAVIEHIHDKIKAKTLFATHFHELTSLSQRLKYLENYHVGIISIDDEKHSFKFSHKVELGGTDKSYGVEVAKLAGIPIEVINRANELLNKNSQSQLKLDI
ncbi:DNA mismatch repair protein MutS, partial [candidate division WWE3 bacterium CG_4_9_14_3_um_filter_34_6]